MRMRRTSTRVLDMFQDLVYLANFLEQVLDNEESARIVAYAEEPGETSGRKYLVMYDGDGSEQTNAADVIFEMQKWLGTLPSKRPPE